VNWSSNSLKRVADVSISNVDKKSVVGDIEVRLVNYTDVYYGDRIEFSAALMEATATPGQVRAFSLRCGDVLITKDSETAEDIGIAAFVESVSDEMILGYHLALLRPRSNSVDGRFLYWAMCSEPVRGQLSAGATGVTRFGLRADVISSVVVPTPPVAVQESIAAFLDTETAQVDAFIAKKSRMIDLLEERSNCRIMEIVGNSELVGHSGFAAAPVRQLLRKQDRWALKGEMITAFRDGEVTSRSVRGREGFTNAWTDDARLQRVDVGDVVIHGLDGFSGAIGDAQISGVCSPVYHVCSAPDGDTAFYGRLLRLLALDGYLGNFAVSTRERAVDFRNWDLFGRIPIPVVACEIQCEIGDQIRAIRPLRDKIRASEALARERRQALINAAMTGKMEIPGVPA
jgi:type I restriction enzyme S subunit